MTVRRIFSCVPGTGAAGTALARRRLPLSDARSPPGTRPTDVSRSLSHNVFYYTEACRNVKNKYELFLNKYNFDESWQIPRAAHTMKREEMTMFSYLFTFRSQTAAQSGRRILYESGLRAQLRRAPPEISGLGCTWALYVGGEDGVHAAQLLRAWNSPVSGAYRMHPNGYLEEAAL